MYWAIDYIFSHNIQEHPSEHMWMQWDKFRVGVSFWIWVHGRRWRHAFWKAGGCMSDPDEASPYHDTKRSGVLLRLSSWKIAQGNYLKILSSSSSALSLLRKSVLRITSDLPLTWVLLESIHKTIFILGRLGGGSVVEHLPLDQVRMPESRDQVPASPSACVSASLCVALMNK